MFTSCFTFNPYSVLFSFLEGPPQGSASSTCTVTSFFLLFLSSPSWRVYGNLPVVVNIAPLPHPPRLHRSSLLNIYRSERTPDEAPELIKVIHCVVFTPLKLNNSPSASTIGTLCPAVIKGEEHIEYIYVYTFRGGGGTLCRWLCM